MKTGNDIRKLHNSIFIINALFTDYHLDFTLVGRFKHTDKIFLIICSILSKITIQ